MTTTFSGPSRLSNLREKKNSLHDDPLNIDGQLKLTLPEQDDRAAYQPSSTFSNTRTSMRLLKGKIDRGQSNDKQDLKSDIKSNCTLQTQPSTNQRLTLLDTKQDMKLILNDDPIVVSEKKVVVAEAAVKPTQKRIMIQKQPSKQQPIIQQPLPKQEEPVKNRKPEPHKQQPKQQQFVNPHDQKPIIKEQEVQESQQPENENDLVLCPEGCGRKFNRKALEKHAKACKIVFMSKRKEFNSEAKRLTSKQQANLVKQNKLKQKNQLGKTKSKGFQKTSDNWKAASQDFRAAIKAIKKDDDEQEEETEQGGEQGNEKQAALKLVSCEFCQKMFAQVLIQKHMENCIKKKQKEKEKKKPAATKKK